MGGLVGYFRAMFCVAEEVAFAALDPEEPIVMYMYKGLGRKSLKQCGVSLCLAERRR